MDLTRIISLGSLVTYVIVILIISMELLPQSYRAWGYPIPRWKRFQRFWKGDVKDNRWKLDWGATIFIWSTLARNIWTVRVLAQHPDKRVNVVLVTLYLLDAVAGALLFYFIRSERIEKRNKLRKLKKGDIS